MTLLSHIQMCDLCYTRYNMLELEGGIIVMVKNSNIRGHRWKAKTWFGYYCVGPYHPARLTSLTNYPDFSHSWQEKLSKYAGALLHIYHEDEKFWGQLYRVLDHKDAP